MDPTHQSDPVERIEASPSNFLNDPKIAPLAGTIDAVVSAGGLHWVGDIVGENAAARVVIMVLT